MYLSHFILNVSVLCERWEETGTNCYIDPTSSLDHSTLCYLQELTYYFFCILAGFAQPGVAEGISPQGAFSVCQLVLTLTFLCPTDSTASAYILLSDPLASASSSAYLHRCISDWRLGKGSIYNTWFILIWSGSTFWGLFSRPDGCLKIISIG